MKSLQYLGAFAARTGVLNNEDIVGSRAELFRALCYVQNRIRRYRELPLLQFLHTGFYCIRVAMNEKDKEGAASVKRRAFAVHSRLNRLCFNLREM